MAAILIVAHAPLASALRVLAGHAYAECSGTVGAVDIPSNVSGEQATAMVAAGLLELAAEETLVLVDAFGATPCNAAISASDGVRSRVVTGVNLAMLWRALCYGDLPLNDLVSRAAEGGRQGILQVCAPRPQHQTNRPGLDDPDSNPDQ